MQDATLRGWSTQAETTLVETTALSANARVVAHVLGRPASRTIPE
ncbi:MAG: hypothetical protein M5U19_09390 [Microthrixaceae bacterium]|nr:hypothetical protein [Microthrixaceae bacterium]